MTSTPACQRPLRLANTDLLQSPPGLVSSTLARIQSQIDACINFGTPLDDVVLFLLSLFDVIASTPSDDVRAASLCLLSTMFDDAFPHSHLCYRGLKVLEIRRKSMNALIPSRTDGGVSFPVVKATRSDDVGVATAAGTVTPGVSPVRSSQHDQSEVGVSQSDVSHRPAADHSTAVHQPDRTAALFLDALLDDPIWRPSAVRLMRNWDASFINVAAFTANPGFLHLYLPHRIAHGEGEPRVYRDFVVCTQRPKLTQTWGSKCFVHVKTNIPAKSDIMYRLLVEGYNYGVNAGILSDVVGCTHRSWDEIGRMEKYGWPAGWDAHSCKDYAPGANIHQYYSSDHFLVVRLQATSMFCVGFTVSAWLVTPGYGAGFPITATIHHQDDDL
jgi:hypothetical protein